MYRYDTFLIGNNNISHLISIGKFKISNDIFDCQITEIKKAPNHERDGALNFYLPKKNLEHKLDENIGCLLPLGLSSWDLVLLRQTRNARDGWES